MNHKDKVALIVGTLELMGLFLLFTVDWRIGLGCFLFQWGLGIDKRNEK